MKKFAIFVSIIAFIASMAALVVALAGIIDRRRELFDSDYDGFDDEMYDDEDMDFYAEPYQDELSSPMPVEPIENMENSEQENNQ